MTTAILQQVPVHDPHQVWPVPPPAPKPWEAALSKAQVKAGMKPDPDPATHLATGNTRLPPPVGPLRKRVIGVRDPSPASTITVLGLAFSLRTYMPLKAKRGQRPTLVPALCVVELADNQVEALKLKASTKFLRGAYAHPTDADEDGRPRTVQLEGPASDFILIEDYLEPRTTTHLADLERENAALKAQLAAMEAKLKEVKHKVSRALPTSNQQ